jgi:A/G-specific adenine glycosylase
LNARLLYKRLERWFARHARELPWRGLTDPYRIWVSEVMLVQTTVAVAIKRYPRFLKKFPTLRSLAHAPLGEVMKEWEGLGYYHRPRYLHQAARIIESSFKGTFPSSYEDIRALPGVGDYVAAAVSNFCFGTRLPAVDANVARVGARLFGIRGDVRSARVRSRIHQRLVELQVCGRGQIWTDGLIEVGALICTPRTPRCAICPLRRDCRAYLAGHQERFGLLGAKASRTEVQVACGVIRRADGRILIAQRPETGLLPGLWEFPGGKRQGRESLADTCRREIREELAIEIGIGEKLMTIRHAYSHYTVRLHVFECSYLSGRPRKLGCQDWRWVRPIEMKRYAFPTANRAIIEAILSSKP